MKKYEHLPIYGIGPVYVISILLLTVAAVLLRNLTVLSTGRLTILRIPLIVMGILFIILFVVMWIQAVVVSKLDENIKKKSSCYIRSLCMGQKSGLLRLYASLYGCAFDCRQCLVVDTSFYLLVDADCAYKAY